MTIQNKRIIASVLFVLISTICVSQTPPPLPPPGPPVAPGLPIDGGVLCGVFVALLYGVKRIISQKN
ncbi:hypothetical protein [Algibacter mikhailovii]|uniref:hypothetical protein n=1 Tax=Algibacter mikhailovii TaxID=425498 RepID=UPI002495406E|nr:hypothetical protein [Algibacter mikhailovii]